MQRRRTEANPAFNRPEVSDLLDAVIALQTEYSYVNAALVRIRTGFTSQEVAEPIRRWMRLTVYDRVQMEGIPIGKLIVTSARQIGMFLVIPALVSAAIVTFIIYTLTVDKIREIAVLKRIGTRNRTIAWMILQQSLVLSVIEFVFQAPHLIPFRDAIDNAALLSMLAGAPNEEARQRALDLLTASTAHRCCPRSFRAANSGA